MRSIEPVWLGFGLAVGYLVSHWVFDGLFLLVGAFPDNGQPAWRSDLWWTDLVNAAQIGFLPAALRIARRGIARDLETLRSQLQCTNAEFTQIRDEISGPGGGARASAEFQRRTDGGRGRLPRPIHHDVR